MYFTKTKFAHSTAGATLLVALSLSTSAFAAGSDQATLTNNERAAQNAIAYSPTYGGHVPSESADATLVYNENAAQRAIADRLVDSEFANFRFGPGSNTASEATLLHNELSAQHAIVDVQTSSTFSEARRSSAALNSSPSNPSAAPR